MTAVAARPRTAGRNGTSPLTGTGELARLALRRDRYFLPAWLYILTAVIASTAYSFKGLYPTGPERAALAASLRGNPSMTALAGPVFGDSLGALTMWKVGLAAAVGAALMGIFTVIRHTRADEEAGRLELVGSTVLGRQAALVASLVVAFGACLAGRADRRRHDPPRVPHGWRAGPGSRHRAHRSGVRLGCGRHCPAQRQRARLARHRGRRARPRRPAADGRRRRVRAVLADLGVALSAGRSCCGRSRTSGGG